MIKTGREMPAVPCEPSETQPEVVTCELRRTRGSLMLFEGKTWLLSDERLVQAKPQPVHSGVARM